MYEEYGTITLGSILSQNHILYLYKEYGTIILGTVEATIVREPSEFCQGFCAFQGRFL